MNTTTRKQLGLPPMPVNANHHKSNPIGIAALFALGIAVGFGIAILVFTFAL